MNRLLPALVVVGLMVVVASPIAVAQEATMADYTEFVRPFLGYWKSTVESDGHVIEGTYWARLSPTNTCGIIYSEGKGLPAIQSIDGYDPVAKKWTVAAFDAEGNFSLNRLVFDVKKGQRYSKGDKGKSEGVSYKTDGTTVTQTSDGLCLECTENRIVAVRSNRKENGEAKPDLTLTLERQSEMRRPTRSPALPVTADEITVADYIEFS